MNVLSAGSDIHPVLSNTIRLNTSSGAVLEPGGTQAIPQP